MTDTYTTTTIDGFECVWSWDGDGGVLRNGVLWAYSESSTASLLAELLPRPDKPIKVGDIVHSQGKNYWTSKMTVLAIDGDQAWCLDADGDRDTWGLVSLKHGERPS